MTYSTFAVLSVMRLSVSYIGCDVEFSLRADEVYTVRSREYVNRYVIE